MTPMKAGAAIAAAKLAVAALPENRRAQLTRRFDLARLQAKWHAEYTRPHR